MLLSEAIKEKEYIEGLIYDLKDYIKSLTSVRDKSDLKMAKNSVDGRLEELRELYKRYQKFCTIIERAKDASAIKLNDTEINLTDAVVIRDSMQHKLKVLSSIAHNAMSKENEGFHICVDLEDLFDELNDLRLDIKTLNSQIEYAFWNIEVS
jgi:hypothetical protein